MAMMDNMEVKKILKSLCFRHGWSYAVFWRYDPINPMLLRVEEAHNDEQAAALVDDMILQTHVLGQGIVGEAALTGNHQWMFSDTPFQWEHEFQNQFLFGFKSIAVIPVGSSGVVQLGSTQKIVERPEMLEETARALQPEEPVVDLDGLFESLVPLGSSELAPPPPPDTTFTFDDFFFTEEDSHLPFLVSPIISEEPLNPSSSDINGDDDSVFDILNSYSVDDLYQLLADDSPEQNCSSGGDQESSIVIQGNDDKDLFDIVGIHSHDSQSFETPQKGLFSELISTSLSNSTSCLTNVQEDSYSGLNHQRKRRKLETSTTSSSFFMAQAETLTPLNPPLWIGEDRSSWKKPQEEEGVKKKKRGESRKPRPKDRQMIQDRIKELRGMVPNGAKCSIDTLLDLTIRHMVFMQSIAKYADKLKQPYQPKLVKEKEKTWVLEVGDDNESVVCPIIVEDLKPQGQMQIEMLCQENGDEFLEIAQVVKSLGLNILKGVMERRQGRIWAHLIVEANPNVTRLQLFYSLVHHLFQQQQQPPHSFSFDHQT